MTGDPRVQRRKTELLAEARLLLDAIASLGPPDGDPFTDPDALARSAEIGLLDAPHLRGNAAACGRIVTRMIGGACRTIDPETGTPISESERVERALGPLARTAAPAEDDLALSPPATGQSLVEAAVRQSTLVADV
jgi:hypothetical protein